MRRVPFIAFLVLTLFLFACGGGDSGDPAVDTRKPGSNIYEFQIIERIADLEADKSPIEGVWQTACVFVAENEYRKDTHAFFLNGGYIHKELFKDDSCNIASSKTFDNQTLYGVVNKMEVIELNNGDDNILVNQLDIQWKRVSLKWRTDNKRRALPPEEVSLVNLSDFDTEVRVYKTIENRLYSTVNFSSTSFHFLDEDAQILFNVSGVESALTEEEIDDLANTTFGTL